MTMKKDKIESSKNMRGLRFESGSMMKKNDFFKCFFNAFRLIELANSYSTADGFYAIAIWMLVRYWKVIIPPCQKYHCTGNFEISQKQELIC